MALIRRRNVVILLLFVGVLVVSGPLARFQQAQDILPLGLLGKKRPSPRENHIPTVEEKLTVGSSNVWEDAQFSYFETAPRDEVLNNTAQDIFILLKTGAETMWDRIPVHVDTTLKRFPSHAIVSDMAALMNGNKVWDVLQFLPEGILNSGPLFGYRVHRSSVDDHWGWGPRKLSIDGQGAGWETDRFKNIPAFILAWRLTDGQKPWYLMIDGDTYVTTSTALAATENRDPDGVWYLGHGAGADPMFAHGGSGIMLSRGAMRNMFREPTDYAWHDQVMEQAAQRALTDCCGDSVVAYEFEQQTGLAADTALEPREDGIFQGNSPTDTRIVASKWCTPVGTFHHVSAWEVQELFNWERIAMRRKLIRGESTVLTYADFYEDFVEPFLVERRFGWSVGDALNETVYKSVSEEVFDGTKRLDPIRNELDCRRVCEMDPECLSWEWQKDKKCRAIINELSVGLAMNSYNPQWANKFGTEVVSGHMLDRIDAIHRSSSCRAVNDSIPTSKKSNTTESTTANRGPGWFFRTPGTILHDEDFVHELTPHPMPLTKANTSLPINSTATK